RGLMGRLRVAGGDGSGEGVDIPAHLFLEQLGHVRLVGGPCLLQGPAGGGGGRPGVCGRGGWWAPHAFCRDLLAAAAPAQSSAPAVSNASRTLVERVVSWAGGGPGRASVGPGRG